MEIGFEIDGITGKEADDIALQVLRLLMEQEFMVTDYWVSLEN
jgi:hypothetical protein